MWDLVITGDSNLTYAVIGIDWNSVGAFYRYKLKPEKGMIRFYIETDDLKLVDRPIGTLCAARKEEG